MDFLDPKKKRAHQHRLFIGYGLVAIALGIATTILVFVAGGYGFNRKTGEIIKNGLVFVDSHPESSRIYINGADKGTTDSRFVLEEGNYSIELKRDGYRTWKHDFVLEGASVERLVYPFLFPTTLQTKDVQLYAAAPDLVTASPDRHWIVSHQPGAFNTFDITDTSTKDNLTKSVTVSADILQPRTNQKLEFVEWSTDNRHLLLRQTYDGGQDFILLDRESPAASTSLTQVFEKSFSQVVMRDKKADQFYGFDPIDNSLYIADAKTKLLTPAAKNVITFWPYLDDTILYVTPDGATTGSVMVKLLQAGKTYNLRELPANTSYVLNIAEFDSHLYVAAGAKSEGKVYVYKDPLNDLKRGGNKLPLARILLKVDAPESVTFSGNARFIAAQGGSRFAIYDAENNRQIRYDTQFKLDAGQKASWMDGHRLMLISEGKLQVFDFNGTNKQTLGAASTAFIPMFDRDYTALFTVSPSVGVQGRTAIVRTELKLVNAN